MRIATVTLLAIACGSALQAQDSWVEISYRVAAANGSLLTFDTGRLFQNFADLPLTSSVDNSSIPTLSALAEASGSVTPGTLRGFTYSEIAYTSQQVILDVVADAEMSLFFGDRLYFQSDTLAPGTPVQFQLTTVLHSIVSQTGTTCGTYPSQAVADDGALGTLNQHYSCDPGPSERTQTSSALLSSTVGGFQNIVGEMDLGGAAQTNAAGQSRDIIGSADASNTGSYFIDILTPGVTFTSASGATYSAAPEPGPASMILLGLLLVMRRRITRY